LACLTKTDVRALIILLNTALAIEPSTVYRRKRDPFCETKWGMPKLYLIFLNVIFCRLRVVHLINFNTVIMSKQESNRRQHLIINLLRNKPCSFEEINEHLKLKSELDEKNYEVSVRTFQRDVKEIAANYNIEINFNRSSKTYEIVLDENDDFSERLMETFDMFNALNLSKTLSKHLLLEKRKPLGLENMHGVLHAIKTQKQIEFYYEKYWDENPSKTKRIVYPLAIKEARNRWYIIAQDPNSLKIKTFGLDRISHLHLLRNSFEYPKGYLPETAFHDCFGIIKDDHKNPEKVVLSFTPNQGKYVKSLPLHHSQKELLNTPYEYQIQLYIKITFDFEMELLSLGSNVKVLEPENLKNSLKAKLQEALALYSI
jgi:proteasome accessory factor B